MKYILIVDDESLMRYSLAAAFESNDTEVVALPDGAGLSKALKDWQFDFCFLDVQLPDASGLDLVKMIRQLAPKTKVIMMTGSTLEAQAMNLVWQYAYLFLTKPFDLFRVKRVLDAVPPSEKNVFQEFSDLEARVAERRRAPRQATAQPITYVTIPVGRKEQEGYYDADLLDISDAGTRIRTNCLLEPGSRVRFKNSVNEAAGIVRWSEKDEKSNACVAGIQFLGS